MSWLILIVQFIIFAACVLVGRNIRRFNKATLDRFDLVNKKFEVIDNEMSGLRYRMDKLEGKHLLRAKDLGRGFKLHQGLPQPRQKGEKDGE